MDSGFAQLDAIIEALKKLGRPDVATEVAKRAAPKVEAEIKKTVQAGTDPLGKAWKPKKDGGQPLRNAASHVTTKAVGNYVVTTLTGVETFHNRGTKKVPRRQILPDGASVPPKVEKALVDAAQELFDEVTKG